MELYQYLIAVAETLIYLCVNCNAGSDNHIAENTHRSRKYLM